MASLVLEFREIVKRFNSVNAVDGVSFSVHSGEIFTLLGPSGCGKTTTLRLVAGLEEPDQGEILIDSVTVAAPLRGLFIPPEKRRLGMVFQSYAIWPHLTVFENVAFPLRVRHESAGRIRQCVHQALERVGLDGLAERGATQLSGGQQQRAAIARSLAMQPKVMLFDEVTSALDPELVGEVLDVMKELALEGTTMIVVTHEMAFAHDVADQVVVMDAGQVVEQGQAEEVLLRPKNPRTASFLSRFHSTIGERKA